MLPRHRRSSSDLVAI
jgi:AP-1 complex subunit mu